MRRTKGHLIGVFCLRQRSDQIFGAKPAIVFTQSGETAHSALHGPVKHVRSVWYEQVDPVELLQYVGLNSGPSWNWCPGDEKFSGTFQMSFWSIKRQ